MIKSVCVSTMPCRLVRRCTVSHITTPSQEGTWTYGEGIKVQRTWSSCTGSTGAPASTLCRWRHSSAARMRCSGVESCALGDRVVGADAATHPYSRYNFRVAIIGRPNVGKSSIFNRIVGHNTSLVHRARGVTRDWKEKDVDFGGLQFTLIDTAGLDEVDRMVFHPNSDIVRKDNRKGGVRHEVPMDATPYGRALSPLRRSGMCAPIRDLCYS
uniref:GTPase Der n=1 Tax=Lygus hesperus TaxID=30085 RepID=A0A0A9WYE0_LYGHE